MRHGKRRQSLQNLNPCTRDRRAPDESPEYTTHVPSSRPDRRVRVRVHATPRARATPRISPHPSRARATPIRARAPRRPPREPPGSTRTARGVPPPPSSARIDRARARARRDRGRPSHARATRVPLKCASVKVRDCDEPSIDETRTNAMG